MDYYQKILKIFKEIKNKKLEAVATLLESVKEEKENRLNVNGAQELEAEVDPEVEEEG